MDRNEYLEYMQCEELNAPDEKSRARAQEVIARLTEAPRPYCAARAGSRAGRRQAAARRARR